MSLKMCKKRKTTNCLFVQMNKSWAMDSMIQRIFTQIQFRPKFLENNYNTIIVRAQHFLGNEIVWFRDWSDPNLNHRPSFTMLLFALSESTKVVSSTNFSVTYLMQFHVNQGQYIIHLAFKDSSICPNVKKKNKIYIFGTNEKDLQNTQ